MLRRSILEISSRYRKTPRKITTQIAAFLSSRKEFSSRPAQNASQGAGPRENSRESSSHLPKIVIGGIVLGAAVLTAYQAELFDKFPSKQKQHGSKLSSTEVGDKLANDVKVIGGDVISPKSEMPSGNNDAEHVEQKVETHADSHIEGLNKMPSVDKFQAEEGRTHSQPEDLSGHSHTSMTSDDQRMSTTTSSEGSLDIKGGEPADDKINASVHVVVPATSDSTVANLPNESEMGSLLSESLETKSNQQDASSDGLKAQSSLLDDYHLRDEADRVTVASSTSTKKGDTGHIKFSNEKEAAVGSMEKINDAYTSSDGKLVLDFLHAIHAAEKRQSELDAQIFSEEKRLMKEKHEKALKDARARELMYAEESAILEKELNRERIKAAAAIKSLQEKAEKKLKMELEQKENEAELKLKEVLELAKAELAAAIASEKASQIEKMAEANLHINALCMAFFARSEEARQSHSVHKLALGALALEDTLSKGLPIQTEIQALRTYLDGIDKDSLLDLVLSSLPEETRVSGTETLPQLHQKFDALKGTLRHFSLIPPGGGGILTHSLAQVASCLKVKETGESGDGIESVINRVEIYLSEGKLAEAADALEEGVRGSQAAEIVGDWVKRARNRAITEQALTLLQSYATSVSLT